MNDVTIIEDGPRPGKQPEDWQLRAARLAKIVSYSCDSKTGIAQRSANSQEIMGLPSIGPTTDWSDCVIPEDLPYFENAVRSITREKPHYEVEYRVRHARTGVRFWVLDRGGGEYNEDGHLTHVNGAVVDISGRISVESEIRAAARLTSLAFEAARIGAWHVEFLSSRMTCTEELLALLGLDPQTYDGELSTIERIVHPEDVEAWRKTHEESFTKGERLEIEFRVVLPNGGIRWLLSRGELVRRFDGRALESYGVMMDISERKTAEGAAAQLAAVVAYSDDAIISSDRSGVVTSWNTGAERLFGYASGEMLGRPLSIIVPEGFTGPERSTRDTVESGAVVPPYESVRQRKDGRMVDVSLTVSPIRNALGQVTGTSTIARDITERRQHIEMLHENQGRLSLALRSARAGAWDFNLLQRELRWSPEMFLLYGLNPANGVPHRKALIAQIPAEHRARARSSFSKAVLQGGSFSLEFPIVRPDGTEIWTAVVGNVIKDANGTPISARGIDQDITERKNWEKRQALLLRELSHRVKNTMAVIQSMTRQTLRNSSNPKVFAEAFEGRIRSLASSHNLLTDADWRGAMLNDIIHSQISGMIGDIDKRLKLRGPDVLLPAETATQLGLVLHELGTNAMKHGALSVPAGRVAITWTATKQKLVLTWSERGGPHIEIPPEHTGFGTALIVSSAGKVSRRFGPEGLTCRLELAL